MNRPMIALGGGFINSIPSRGTSTALYQVNVSNGMPIVIQKPVLSEKSKQQLNKKKK